jgi:hypothetical protein
MARVSAVLKESEIAERELSLKSERTTALLTSAGLYRGCSFGVVERRQIRRFKVTQAIAPAITIWRDNRRASGQNLQRESSRRNARIRIVTPRQG